MADAPAAPPVEPTLDDLEARLGALGGDATEARVDALIDLGLALPLAEIPRRLVLAEDAYLLAEQLGYTLGKARAAGLEGESLFLRSDHEPALMRLTEAQSLYEGLGVEAELFPFRNALAGVHVSLGNYEEALTMALANLETLRAQGNEVGEGWVLHGLSGAYLELGDAERALDYGMQALALFTRVSLPQGQGRAHSSIGTALRLLGRYDEARAHHQVSLRLFRETEEPVGEARALHDLGALCQARGGYEQALEYHRQALALRRALGNRQAQSTCLIHIGQTLVALGRTDEAMEALHEALGIAEALKARPRIFQAHEALAEAYEAAGEAEKALHHTRQFHVAREEVLSAQTRGRIQTMQVRMEAERAVREAEIERLRNTELREKNEALERLLNELKATQARLVQSEKLASLGRITAGIAHEIKNPLNFITNFAQLNGELARDLHAVVLARKAELPADLAAELDDSLGLFAGNAERVLTHARRADGIVRSMLGHVRSTGGERRPVDLHPVIDGALEHTFGSRDGDGTVAVERAYDAEVGEVEAVPQSLQRVFVNLFENARYAATQGTCDGGPPRLTVTTRMLPGLVQVRVEDNGPGIPAELCSRLFEPFFTTKPPGEGTGLGLSLAYDIVTQGHGGSMAALSREGQGATFVVTLPAGA